MSQAAEDILIPPAFKRNPVNPYRERAEEFQKQLDTSVAPTTVTVEDSQPAAQVETPAPQPVVPPSPPAQPQVEQSSFDYSPPAYNNDPALLAHLQRMEQERTQLAQQIEQQNQAISNLMNSQRELDAFKAQQSMYANMDPQAFDSLSSMDPEDAKKLSAGMLNATAKAIAPLREELAQQRQLIEQRAQQQRQEMEAARIRALNARVLAAHPDYYQLVGSKQYQDFMAQRDGLSSKTRDMRAAEEFLAGNTDYVIDLLNQIKGKTPPVEAVQTVAPVQVATSSGAVSVAPQRPLDTLADLNSLFRRGQLSHDEYRKRLAALRAASKE